MSALRRAHRLSTWGKNHNNSPHASHSLRLNFEIPFHKNIIHAFAWSMSMLSCLYLQIMSLWYNIIWKPHYIYIYIYNPIHWLISHWVGLHTHTYIYISLFLGALHHRKIDKLTHRSLSACPFSGPQDALQLFHEPGWEQFQDLPILGGVDRESTWVFLGKVVENRSVGKNLGDHWFKWCLWALKDGHSRFKCPLTSNSGIVV